MPYPVSKLAYGLRCRLRELATPSESYRLQIAAGKPSICPRIQKSQKTSDRLEFIYLNSSEVHVYESTVSDGQLHMQFLEHKKDGCVVYSGMKKIVCCYANSQNFDAGLFDCFAGQVSELQMRKCQLSDSLFEKVATAITGTTDVSIFGSTNNAYHVNVGTIMSYFPNVETIFLKDVKVDNTWMKSPALLDNHDLMTLHLPITVKKYCTYSQDDIIDFLKAQKKGFHLRIYLREGSADYKRELSDALGTKFDTNPESVGSTKVSFVHHKTWYLPDV